MDVYAIETRYHVDGKSRHEFPSFEAASEFRDRINENDEKGAQKDKSRNFAWNLGWSTKK